MTNSSLGISLSEWEEVAGVKEIQEVFGVGGLSAEAIGNILRGAKFVWQIQGEVITLYCIVGTGDGMVRMVLLERKGGLLLDIGGNMPPVPLLD
ncbi:hypothetical protein GC194_10920 [bacterium]|nr:hypothetical protein [bacterium]